MKLAGKPQRSGGRRKGAGRKSAPLAKVGFYCLLPLSTLESIRRLAAENGKSQSEVVDRAMEAYRLLTDLLQSEEHGYCYFGTNYPVNMEELFQEMKTWKEQSQ